MGEADLIIERCIYLPEAVLGRLYFGDVVRWCLEPGWFHNKPFKSCIPEGVYPVRPFSGDKFGDHWEVCNVPGRTAILFHVGNYPEETEGCIMPGRAHGLPGRVAVWSSEDTFGELYGFLAGVNKLRVPILKVRSVTSRREEER